MRVCFCLTEPFAPLLGLTTFHRKRVHLSSASPVESAHSEAVVVELELLPEEASYDVKRATSANNGALLAMPSARTRSTVEKGQLPENEPKSGEGLRQCREKGKRPLENTLFIPKGKPGPLKPQLSPDTPSEPQNVEKP